MVGIDSILLIGIVALLLFGPDKLPQYLREMGKIYAEVKKAQREFERELSPQLDPLVSRPMVKQPSDKVLEIARKMGIGADGKSEEQLLAEIAAAVPTQNDTSRKDAIVPEGTKKDI